MKIGRVIQMPVLYRDQVCAVSFNDFAYLCGRIESSRMLCCNWSMRDINQTVSMLSKK